MLTIEALTVEIAGKKILDIKQPITFEKGDRVGIIGSNGAGKTTLIKTLLGRMPYDGEIVTTYTPSDMAVHLQENNYVQTVSVKGIIEAVLNCKVKSNAKLQELIQFFEFEESLSKKYKQLSGGQKQRLTIILVLMQEKPITFFDEVTSGLDFETRQQLMEKINDWYQGSDDTVFLVSHYYDELETLTNKLILIEKGQIVTVGEKTELFKKYCGYSTIIVDNREENKKHFTVFKQLVSPNHLLAFSCSSQKEEIEVINMCLKNNINFKRSDNDIEIMTMNAKRIEGFNHETK